MGRYNTEHKIVDVSPIPLISALAKKAIITDTKTGAKAEGWDWNSYKQAEAKAWEKLQQRK